ncbi:unnamed protein product [Alopecurus aequalis]
MSSPRRRPRPSAAMPLDDYDLLSEILLRLPPQPSSLPRASAVCRSWRSLVTDARFLRRFRLRHRRNPPLLGFFHRDDYTTSFVPALEAPNRVPPGRFSLQFANNFRILGCRHGLVLIFYQNPLQFLVWDPVTGNQSRLAIPPGFDPSKAHVNGAVLCCRRRRPALQVGDSLYWEIVGTKLNIVEFDLETESLSLIRVSRADDVLCFAVMPAQGGGLGFLSLSGFTAQLWKRKTDSDGVVSWVMETTVELDKLLSLDSDSDDHIGIRGFAEDNNSVFLYTAVSIFIVQFEPLQFKKLAKPDMEDHCHPFESIYAAGI